MPHVYILLFCFFTSTVLAKERPYYCTVSIHTDEFAYQLLEDEIHEERNVPLYGTAKNAKLFRDALQKNVFGPISKTYRDNGVPVAFVAGELKASILTMVDCASQNVTQPFICSPSYSGKSELVVEASHFWREQRPCILLYVSGHPLRDGTGRSQQSVGYTADGSGHYGMCAASTEDQIKDYGHGSLIVISAVDMDDVDAGIEMDHLTMELRKRLNRAMGCDKDNIAKCSSIMSSRLRSLAAANDGCLETEDPTPKLDADYSRTLNLLSNVDRMMEFTKSNGRTDGVYVATGDIFAEPTEMKFRPRDSLKKPTHTEL